MKNKRNPEDALGEAPSFLAFQQELREAAKIDRPILIIGERGSGKELAAERIHYLSPRWQAPLITLNCAALSPSLIETELFGHEVGSFTGATRQRKGRFGEAHGGTLFLDEIGLIPLEVQEKILRVVEYGLFERVGGTETIEVDVRIIGATNADLPSLAREEKFKPDLLDRLAFEVLFLPPLRRRREDIPLLANYFAGRMAREMGLPGEIAFSPEVIETLLHFPWPGNIRELKNVVERAVYRSRGGMITSVVLDPFKNPFASGDTAPPLPEVRAASLLEKGLGEGPYPPSLAEAPAAPGGGAKQPLESFLEARRDLERDFLYRALEACGGSKKAAAQKLGLTYDQFRGLWKRVESSLGQAPQGT